jgi:hypothetical protein
MLKLDCERFPDALDVVEFSLKNIGLGYPGGMEGHMAIELSYKWRMKSYELDAIERTGVF